MSSAWLLTCAWCSGGSALPSSGEFRRTWKLSWQWNSQLPERSGTHVIENVRPARGALRHHARHRRRAAERAVHAPVAAAVHVEVEAVQVHRVHRGARVDDAIPHGVADVVRQPLGVRPRLAVDRESQLVAAVHETVGEGALHPQADHEHAVVRASRSACVHDERAVQLGVRSREAVGGAAADDLPRVVVRSRRAGRKPQLARRARRDLHRVARARRAARRQTTHHERAAGPRVGHPRDDRRSLRHADQRPRNARPLSSLRERAHDEPRLIVTIRPPVHLAHLEVEREHTTANVPAGVRLSLIAARSTGAARSSP